MASSVAPDSNGGFARAFHLETLDMALGKRPRSAGLPVSLAFHAVALAGLVVVPALTGSQLPEPSAAVRAFFVQAPAEIAPPPPPPPPAAKAAVRPRVQPEQASTDFVAPVEIPVSVPQASLDLGLEGGMPGGVEGGVEGGVVGGVVGGLPAAPPPPATPLRVGGGIKEPRKLRNVAPEYPALAQRARISGVVVIDAVIGADGRVTNARVLRGLAMLDEAALTAVRQWVYTPTLVSGVPVPVEMTVTVTFSLTG
jgi:periplasmic protein TonB